MKKQSSSKTNNAKKALDKDLDRDIRSIRDGNRRELSTVAQRYLRALVDPATAPRSGVPTLIGGNPGRTSIENTKMEGKMVVGTNGWGYLSIPNPEVKLNNSALANFGPFISDVAMDVTTAAYTGVGPIQTALGRPAGLAAHAWSSPFSSSIGYKDGKLMYRCVGMSVEIFPESSFVDQNGSLVLYEVEQHSDLTYTAAVTVENIQGYENSRVIRATQTGSQKEKIMLNWHPRALIQDGSATSTTQLESTQNDFFFIQPVAGWNATLQVPTSGLFVGAEAKPGTEFHYVVSAMWEVRGNLVRGKKHRLTDSRGMDLVCNMINRKVQSGYVGQPNHAYESYLHVAASAGRKLAGRAGKWALSTAADYALKAIAGFI